MTEKKYYFLKLNPPRPSFMNDMTEEERTIMLQHGAYWRPYVESGVMVVMGPVADPHGGYGLGIIRVETEEELHALIAKDPANGLGSYEIYPMMRAVTKI